MKQFKTILKFELKGYLKNKAFVGITVFLVVAIAVVMFIPNIVSFFQTDEEPDAENSARPLMLVQSENEALSALIQQYFAEGFPDYDVRVSEGDEDQLKERITSGAASCGFFMESPSSYTYYVNNLSMYDMNTEVANGLLQNVYRVTALVQLGLSSDEAAQIIAAPIESRIETLGINQMENFFYTYIMIFALYMVILLYGQMVATGVATEKSSRAMEVLITSAKPTAMMFGKVLAACLAGLAQLVAIFGSAVLFYQLNRSAWGDNPFIETIFNIPVSLLVFMLVFFILGFLIYAFLYGAIGSTASKLEDINTSVMPVTFLFIIGFMVTIFSMTGGDVDTLLMRICSYVPFTSPMAMFTRIAMSTVAWYEIAVSIALLIGSVIGIGVLSAKIYRVGVLLYGTPPKLGAILKSLWKA